MGMYLKIFTCKKCFKKVFGIDLDVKNSSTSQTTETTEII